MKRPVHLEDEAAFRCPTCGEEIVVPIDVLAGADQEYVEDCPVCCRPSVLHVRARADGTVSLTAEGE